MADRLTPERRSYLMSRVRGKDTTPELRVRKMAHALGFRFRLHRRDLPGKPDLIFPRLGKIVLVHGCFWHRHEECRLTTRSKSRTDYWEAKFEGNVERDRRVQAELRALGWDVLVVWECETREPEVLEVSLRRFLADGYVAPGAKRR
jgi:DNA mismatch endonuclease (patch repair protein)